MNRGIGSLVVKKFWPMARECRFGRVVSHSGIEPVRALASRLRVPRLVQPAPEDGRLPESRLWLKSNTKIIELMI